MNLEIISREPRVLRFVQPILFDWLRQQKRWLNLTEEGIPNVDVFFFPFTSLRQK